jgi:hypothetical protein
MSTLDLGLVMSLLRLVILHATPAVLQFEQGVVLSQRILRTRQVSHYRVLAEEWYIESMDILLWATTC